MVARFINVFYGIQLLYLIKIIFLSSFSNLVKIIILIHSFVKVYFNYNITLVINLFIHKKQRIYFAMLIILFMYKTILTNSVFSRK